jgi:PDZ domain-containing protein
MSQRTGVGVLAFGLMAALWAVAGFAPLPYVVYSPGPTYDILAESAGEEIVQIEGAKAYRDDGELRLTTIYVSQPEERVTLPSLVKAYFSEESAIYPRSSVYRPTDTDESHDQLTAVQMASSQDNAIAVALKALGHDVKTIVEVTEVADDMPAAGLLQPGDQVLAVDLVEITGVADVGNAVGMVAAGDKTYFRILRGGKEEMIEMVPREVDGRQMVGIGVSERHEFPFEVKVGISDNIGGPSAGLMMSLAVYDTLTEGSLTDGHVVAGSGEIAPDGAVGPIGGAQQKVAAARDTGVELFLLPAGNCDDLSGIETDDMTLASVESMQEALDVIETWVDDPDADIPTCEDKAS